MGCVVGTWGVWRIMNNQKIAGFTLIELLAVIAIIGILAGFVAVGVPRALEKAKIADVQNDFLALRNALTTYAADFQTYPPGYGYRRMTDQQIINAGGDPFAVPYDTSIPDAQLFFLDNYMDQLGQFKAFDLYDRFNNDSHDANSDNAIQLMEYRPVGTPDPGNPLQFFGFAPDRYVGGNNGTEVSRMLDDHGPYIYIPVNSLQAQRYAQYCMAGYNATGDIGYANAQYFDPLDPTTVNGRSIGDRYLSRVMTFPPPEYDAFVLISVGPFENVSGILPGPLPGQGPTDLLDAYHIMGLRAYFLATRDINTNGKLDFDFKARTQQGEDSTAFADPALGLMPDGTGSQGPMIFKQGG